MKAKEKKNKKKKRTLINKSNDLNIAKIKTKKEKRFLISTTKYEKRNFFLNI